MLSSKIGKDVGDEGATFGLDAAAARGRCIALIDRGRLRMPSLGRRGLPSSEGGTVLPSEEAVRPAPPVAPASSLRQVAPPRARSSSAPSTPAGGAGRVWRVLLLIVSLAGATAGVLLLTEAQHFVPVRHTTHLPFVWAILLVAFAVAVIAPVSVHYRGDSYLFVLTEIPLLVGLAFLSPLQLVAARVAGEVIGLGALRRQSPLKLAFNLTSGACGAAVAALVYHSAIGGSLAVSPLGYAAGAAALATAAVLVQITIHLVIRLNGERIPRRTSFEVRTAVLLLLASTGLALVVLDAAWWDAWAVVPLVIVGALIVFAYRGYSRLTQRFSSLQRLYDYSDSLGSIYHDPNLAAAAVLTEVQNVMRARRAQLYLLGPDGRICERRTEQWPTVPDTVVLSEDSIVARVVESGSASLVCNQAAQGRLTVSNDPMTGEFRDALVAPLRSSDRVVGALLALDRDEALDSFDADDLRLFEALAAHAIATMERAQLVDRLHQEAADKQHRATHDSLTQLPNRSLFLTSAAEALDSTGRAAVVLMDIDRFKDVNDTLGHDMGDRLLCDVARRLIEVAHGRATVARIGGDEFALVVPDIVGPEEAIGLLRDIHAALGRPFDFDGLPIAITASSGIALAPDHGHNVAALLQRADIAMYSAKERRHSIELYSATRDQSMQRRLMLGGQLLHALEADDQLSVVFQPIADLATGAVLRVEALARWHHPELGSIPAPEFVGISEQIGLIGRLTEFVLSESLAQASKWRRAGIPVGLAVNLSGRELLDDQLVDLVTGLLAAHRFPPHGLTLELTETEVMADLGQASAVLARLARLGLRIAVDDYGTGYSSLAYLHRLPVEELKIDRSFVTGLAEDPSNRIIVRSSIAMAHSLGLTVVAEGAEDEVTCAILAEAGCDAVQGYYFARPKTAEQVHELLSSGTELSFSREVPPLHPLRVVDGEPPRKADLSQSEFSF